jgi:hypothetical protein
MQSGREGMEMGLGARRDAKRAAFDFGKAAVHEILPDRGFYGIAADKHRPAVGMDVAGPPWGRLSGRVRTVHGAF